MLPGLDTLELGRLRMSVGYGGNRKGRLLSPIEVGRLLRKARDNGANDADILNNVKLDNTNIKRFLKITELPDDLQHLVVWGKGKDAIGFTAAVELSGIQDHEEQRTIAGSILTHGLNSKEVRQVVQLRKRSGRSITDCVVEVVGMRSIFEKRYVFIGAITETSVKKALEKLSQSMRDSLLQSAIIDLGIKDATGRLGETIFTIVGGEQFEESMIGIGKQSVETLIREHIYKAVEDSVDVC